MGLHFPPGFGTQNRREKKPGERAETSSIAPFSRRERTSSSTTSTSSCWWKTVWSAGDGRETGGRLTKGRENPSIASNTDFGAPNEAQASENAASLPPTTCGASGARGGGGGGKSRVTVGERDRHLPRFPPLAPRKPLEAGLFQGAAEAEEDAGDFEASADLEDDAVEEGAARREAIKPRPREEEEEEEGLERARSISIEMYW